MEYFVLRAELCCSFDVGFTLCSEFPMLCFLYRSSRDDQEENQKTVSQGIVVILNPTVEVKLIEKLSLLLLLWFYFCR